MIVLKHPAWNLVILGALIALLGLLWLAARSIPWLGRLPGDIVIERESYRFFFPLTTCVLVSLVLSGILWLLRFFWR